jgi:cytidylate kinase
MQFHHGIATVLVNGKDVTGDLRTPEVSSAASVVSAIPSVRAWLLPIQRQIGQDGAVVAEGRDMGTNVFPEADVKFFLEADPTVRAQRRHRDIPGRLKKRRPTWWAAIRETVPDRSPRWSPLKTPVSSTLRSYLSLRSWTR